MANSKYDQVNGEILDYTISKMQTLIDAKADSSELETHADDTTAHITAAERTAWNAKQDALTFDSTPTSGSTKPVTSGGVYTALSNKQDTLTFDSAPTSGSANPVTSGGVYTALSTKADSSELDAKQDALTFDTTPTSDSSNPVTSGGVYDYANSLGTHIVATGGTGAAYTATVPGITALTAGVGFIMVTNVVSTSTTPTLDVNSLGAKTIKRRISTLGSQVASGYSAAWLTASKAYHVVYDGTYWIVENMTQAAAADLYGTVSMIKGGTGVTTLADTTYTTARYRGSALYSSDTAPTVNGVINWTYA